MRNYFCSLFKAVKLYVCRHVPRISYYECITLPHSQMKSIGINAKVFVFLVNENKNTNNYNNDHAILKCMCIFTAFKISN